MAAIDWDAATAALAAGELPCSDVLTGLVAQKLDVGAARLSHQVQLRLLRD
jgi:hypothetical protein